jgi:hypothetical protein
MFNFEDINMEYAMLPVVAILLIIMYATIIISFYKDTTNDNNIDRVINNVNATIRGEIESLKKISNNENPYDLFTRIYPTIKDMNNERIDELIDILSNYNSNWISDHNE